MNFLDRVRGLNVFARVKELEAREQERDDALELMLVHLEAVQVYMEKRLVATSQQTARMNAVVGYDLDIKCDLDVA
jgi:hypothetical protein